MNPAIKLQALRIEKSFPGVKALDKVNLAVRQGTVHAICGENGAGKSTLMKVIIGLCRPDSGQILIDDKAVNIQSPVEARRHGVSMIFQELNYVPEMTVEESFFLGNWPTAGLGRVNWKAVRTRASVLLKNERLPYSPRTKLRDLTVSDIQMLEIVKAISYNSDVIIMDEPTSAITSKEAESLFAKIDDLRRRNKAILYISHRMDEIFRVADEITVLRDGRVVDSRPTNQYEPETLIAQMVGRTLDGVAAERIHALGDEALRVKRLSRTGRFQDVSFHVRAGEIVGLAGLVGAGRTDVLRVLFGLDRADSSDVLIRKQKVRIRRVADSIARGMVMLTEDRHRYGIVPVRSVRENVALSSLRSFIYGGRLHAQKEDRAVRDSCQAMNVKTPTIETEAAALSGGNQQKLLFARWLLTNPEILLLDEPTRGMDVAAKGEIHRLMRSLAGQGKALVLVSSELPELLLLCDRIYVMAQGAVTGMLTRDRFSQETIMAYATGLRSESALSA